MILYQIPILILTLSLVSIFIAPEEPLAFKLFFKLLPMIVIIMYAFRLVPRVKRAVHWFIIAGLLFSLLGDATMHWFPIGLGTYFLAHICYTIGFFSVSHVKKPHLFIVIPIGLYIALFGWLLASRIQGSTENVLFIPVILYVIMISITFLAASLTKNKQAIIGSFLYIVSHSILLWNEFIYSFVYAESIVMFIYYAAQFFIAVSLYSILEKNRRIIW